MALPDTGAAPVVHAAASALGDDAVGLGLRRGLIEVLDAAPDGAVDFLELAPENWLGVGGRLRDALDRLALRYPLVCHGLSLSVGGPAGLDEGLLRKTRAFLEQYRCPLYSEHLSACGDSRGLLYDLLPLPFTDAAVRHVAARIRRSQDILGRRIAVENVAYYAAPFQAMPEIEFVNAVLEAADCDLLLDVNNIVVNATNHGYDAHAFLHALPARRIAYIHVAGHSNPSPGLKVDTHGAAVDAAVWALLADAYRSFGPRPTLLERDFELPPFDVLLDEIDAIRGCIRRPTRMHKAA